MNENDNHPLSNDTYDWEDNQEKTPQERLDQLIEDEKLTRWEGEKGVQNLAILARALGYKDTTYFGQFSHRACYGDLIRFLEDNPGAVEAVVEFIRENADAYDLGDEEE